MAANGWQCDWDFDWASRHTVCLPLLSIAVAIRPQRWFGVVIKALVISTAGWEMSIGQEAVTVLCGWKGSRSSGVTPATSHQHPD